MAGKPKPVKQAKTAKVKQAKHAKARTTEGVATKLSR